MNDLLANYGDVLTIKDVQEILKTGKNTANKYLKTGIIKSLIVGGKYRIPKLYMIEYLYPNSATETGVKEGVIENGKET